jgi:hypothetical protein
MVGFGYKQAWLAVREVDTRTAAAAADMLGLRDLGPVRWQEGIDLTYLTDDRVAMTPALAGVGGDAWVLVVGRWLLLRYDVDVAHLSAALRTEVQAFASHRVVEAHQWERAVNGLLVRAFGYVGESGEVTRWEGERDPAEATLGLPAGPHDTVLVGEEDVMRMAGAWSVDPSGLDGRPAPGPLRMFAAR